MVNPHFCQQELEAKPSLIPVTMLCWTGSLALPGFARMRVTVDKGSHIKTVSIFFQSICLSNTMFWFKQDLYATDCGQHGWHRSWVNYKS